MGLLNNLKDVGLNAILVPVALVKDVVAIGQKDATVKEEKPNWLVDHTTNTVEQSKRVSNAALSTWENMKDLWDSP